MFGVYHEKKPVRKKLGYVGEFCPYCRSFQNISVCTVKLASHVWAIRVETGQLLRHEGTCKACRGIFRVDLDESFTNFLHDPMADIVELVQLTQPYAHLNWGHRLEIEEQVIQDPHQLPKDVREALLAEPFQLTTELAEEIGIGNEYLDWTTVWTAAGFTLLVVLVSRWIGQNYPGDSLWIFAPMGIGLVGFLVTFAIFGFSGRRRLRRIFKPLFQRAIFPLKPTRLELDAFWPRLRGHMLGKVLRATDLLEPADRK